MTVQTHKHRSVPLCFSRTKPSKDNVPQRLPRRWNTAWNGNRAAEPVSVLKARHNNHPPLSSRFLLPSPPSPRCMSGNIKSPCSSKVSPIKSTYSSADKTANVKMVKKRPSPNAPLIFLRGEANSGRCSGRQGIMGDGVGVSSVIYHLSSRRNHTIGTGNWCLNTHTHILIHE